MYDSEEIVRPIARSATGDERFGYYNRSLDSSVSPRRQCNRCPGCLRLQNISEYSHEATPLLASNRSSLEDGRCYDKMLIAAFIVLLLVGSGAGIFLIYFETRGAIIEEFDFVSRERWGVNSTLLKDLPPLHPPVSKVLLLELMTNCTGAARRCLEYEEFHEDDKEKINIFNGKVLYNFYQDISGKIFEGRGWNFQSDCGQHDGCTDVLTIGILENMDSPPNAQQVQELKAFLDYGVMDNELINCYEILVSHSSKRYFDDLAYSLAAMNRKDRICEYYYK